MSRPNVSNHLAADHVFSGSFRSRCVLPKSEALCPVCWKTSCQEKTNRCSRRLLFDGSGIKCCASSGMEFLRWPLFHTLLCFTSPYPNLALFYLLSRLFFRSSPNQYLSCCEGVKEAPLLPIAALLGATCIRNKNERPGDDNRGLIFNFGKIWSFFLWLLRNQTICLTISM